MNAQLAEAFSVAPGGKTASMIVAIVKNRQLARFPPIIAHLRPTFSMHTIQTICSTISKTDDIPCYLIVSLVLMPMFPYIVGE